jgi:hypothetical protein
MHVCPNSVCGQSEGWRQTGSCDICATVVARSLPMWPKSARAPCPITILLQGISGLSTKAHHLALNGRVLYTSNTQKLMSDDGTRRTRSNAVKPDLTSLQGCIHVSERPNGFEIYERRHDTQEQNGFNIPNLSQAIRNTVMEAGWKLTSRSGACQGIHT